MSMYALELQSYNTGCKARIGAPIATYERAANLARSVSNEHTAELLGHILALRELLRAHHDAMVAAAIGTGHTSLVNTVRGIETALERAEHKVRRVTTTKDTP